MSQLRGRFGGKQGGIEEDFADIVGRDNRTGQPREESLYPVKDVKNENLVVKTSAWRSDRYWLVDSWGNGKESRKYIVAKRSNREIRAIPAGQEETPTVTDNALKVRRRVEKFWWIDAEQEDDEDE